MPTSRDRDQYDDYDDERPTQRPAKIPGGVKAAGIIWIVFGVLIVTAEIGSFVLAAKMGGGNRRQATTSGPCTLILAIVFILIGYQAIRGASNGILGSSIFSLVFAAIYGFMGVGGLYFGLAGRNQMAGTFLTLGIIGLIVSIPLIVAGILGIVGRKAYADYRNEVRRRLQRDSEQDDYDDRPRRRRERDEHADDLPQRRPDLDDNDESR